MNNVALCSSGGIVSDTEYGLQMLKRYIVMKHVRQLFINSPIKVSPTLWYKNKMKRETSKTQPLVTVQDFSALLYVLPMHDSD